ncbi:hypothetical protein STFE110948_02890 [Streptobacillus felis]|uniref:hypothetical protein n=1 Tax=Streptobacillus felis TaxID=1384509 RepID=UPI000ABC06C6|nr:hypothetical protein [Streptobacillus felis]
MQRILLKIKPNINLLLERESKEKGTSKNKLINGIVNKYVKKKLKQLENIENV